MNPSTVRLVKQTQQNQIAIICWRPKLDFYVASATKFARSSTCSQTARRN